MDSALEDTRLVPYNPEDAYRTLKSMTTHTEFTRVVLKRLEIQRRADDKEQGVEEELIPGDNPVRGDPRMPMDWKGCPKNIYCARPCQMIDGEFKHGRGPCKLRCPQDPQYEPPAGHPTYNQMMAEREERKQQEREEPNHKRKRGEEAISSEETAPETPPAPQGIGDAITEFMNLTRAMTAQMNQANELNQQLTERVRKLEAKSNEKWSQITDLKNRVQVLEKCNRALRDSFQTVV